MKSESERITRNEMQDSYAGLKQRLLQLLRTNSLQLGHFVLTSGKRSLYYFDSKFTTLHPEGAYLTARLILETIKREELSLDAIGGLTLGADPIVAAVAAVSHAERELYPPLSAFIVRKQPKGHGAKRQLEGYSPPPGTPVAIVDDVCTTGGSTLQAIEQAEQAGCCVKAVLCLVDREEGGSEALRDYRFLPLIQASELLDQPAIQARLRELEATLEAAPESNTDRS